MTRCQNCQHEIPSEPFAPSVCPSCGAAVATAAASDTPPNDPPETPCPIGESDWAAIARMKDVAEVGYFADSLEAAGIPTNIHQESEYHAINGTWGMNYILRVPRGAAAEAAAILQEEVANDPPAEDESTSLPASGSAAAWKPWLLVLVAGGLAYSAGRGMEPAAVPRGGGDEGLWNALSESPTLSSHSAPGRPSQRLRYEATTSSLLLEDDLDGDGLVDRVRRFQKHGR